MYLILWTSNSLTSQNASPLVNCFPNKNVLLKLSEDSPLSKVQTKYISGQPQPNLGPSLSQQAIELLLFLAIYFCL